MMTSEGGCKKVDLGGESGGAGAGEENVVARVFSLPSARGTLSEGGPPWWMSPSPERINLSTPTGRQGRVWSMEA